MYNKHGILGLFILLVIILMLKPRVIFNLHNNILGRVVLIGVVLFFTMNNVTLGLLTALCLIIASNMFFMEGLTNLSGNETPMIQPGLTKGSGALTVGDDNIDGSLNNGNTISVETKEQVKAKAIASGKDGAKISELQEQAQTGGQTQGVDRTSIQESIQAKNPKTIPVDKSVFRSEEVSASDPTTTEPFVSSYSKF
jgi:hypothetical protein